MDRAASTTPRKAGTVDRLTAADLIVLVALAEKPTHGYELVAALERREGGAQAKVSRAQIYYSLKKLLRLGSIVAVKDSGPPAGPERERYRVSAGGRRAMATALSQPEWARERPPIPFHLWLQLIAQADPVDRAAVLRERRAFLDEQIAAESQRLEEMRRSGAVAEAGQAVTIAVVAHAIEVCRLERELLEAVEPMLK